MSFNNSSSFIKKNKNIIFLISLSILIVSLYTIGFYTVQDISSEREVGKSIEVQEAHPVTGPLTVEVHLRKVFLDGNESVEVQEETIWSMEDFWSQYASWQLVDQNDERILFEKQIDDISPVLKINGYFGITENGVLSIFEGSPENQEVIQSFFQIDVKELESYLQQKLKVGIPVKSKENYLTVLKQFQQYTIQ